MGLLDAFRTDPETKALVRRLTRETAEDKVTWTCRPYHYEAKVGETVFMVKPGGLAVFAGPRLNLKVKNGFASRVPVHGKTAWKFFHAVQDNLKRAEKRNVQEAAKQLG